MSGKLAFVATSAEPLFGPFDNVEELVFFLAIVVLASVGLVLLYLALKQFKRGVLILTNSPVPAGEVYLEDGTVELEGTAAELDGTISGKYSNKSTLAHTWEKKEKETTRDSDGNKKTNWKTVRSGENSVPFLVEDETGSVAVDPEDASFSFDTSRQSGGGRRHRYYEGNLQPGDTVHVYGQKREAVEEGEAPGDDRFYVGDCDDGSEFLVSDTTQYRTALRYFLSGLPWLLGTVIVLGFTVVFGVAMLNEVFGIDVLALL